MPSYPTIAARFPTACGLSLAPIGALEYRTASPSEKHAHGAGLQPTRTAASDTTIIGFTTGVGAA